MNIDYIIIGQGLAGSAVAIQLLKRKRTFVVFDDPSANNSSRIAAGLFNPITGKKMVRSRLARMLFPYLTEFYRHVERETHSEFFHPLPMYRPFVSVEEQNEWMAKSSEQAFESFIKTVYTGKTVSGTRDELGGLLLQHTGFVNTSEYIKACRILIDRSASLLTETFISEKLEVEGSSVRYGDLQARRIIFCNGIHQNKWFSWLPIRPLKGETITIQAEVQQGMIINRGVYMVPMGQGSWRVGSTYNFQDQTATTTADGKKELEENVRALISSDFTITDHAFGFRPTTPDRRPILGPHPETDRVVIFNGLGTKGISLAPYFSEVLVRWLENEGSINKEVDIERFKSVYWASP